MIKHCNNGFIDFVITQYFCYKPESEFVIDAVAGLELVPPPLLMLLRIISERGWWYFT